MEEEVPRDADPVAGFEATGAADAGTAASATVALAFTSEGVCAVEEADETPV